MQRCERIVYHHLTALRWREIGDSNNVTGRRISGNKGRIREDIQTLDVRRNQVIGLRKVPPGMAETDKRNLRSEIDRLLNKAAAAVDLELGHLEHGEVGHH